MDRFKILKNIQFSILLLIVFCFLKIGISNAEIYKWVEKDGKVNFSDNPPLNNSSTKVEFESWNTVSIEDSEKPELFKHDSFRMPYSTSRIPYRFIMTSAMNVDQPVDRLSSIEININQRVFHTHIQLNGVESNKKYKLRVRVIDAKGELIFDKDKVLTPSSNSIWFAATVSPKVNIDEPGTWTIQGVLNGKKLFIEKREITFPQRKKKEAEELP